MGLTARDVRVYQGRVLSSDSGFQAIALGGYYDFVDISNNGALRFVTVMVNAGTDSHKALPKITIDGVDVEPDSSIQALNARGYDKDTEPLKITAYAVDGLCHVTFTFIPVLLFEQSLRIRVTNGSATDAISVACTWVYYSR